MTVLFIIKYILESSPVTIEFDPLCVFEFVSFSVLYVNHKFFKLKVLFFTVAFDDLCYLKI